MKIKLLWFEGLFSNTNHNRNEVIDTLCARTWLSDSLNESSIWAKWSTLLIFSGLPQKLQRINKKIQNLGTAKSWLNKLDSKHLRPLTLISDVLQKVESVRTLLGQPNPAIIDHQQRVLNKSYIPIKLVQRCVYLNRLATETKRKTNENISKDCCAIMNSMRLNRVYCTLSQGNLVCWHRGPIS